MGLDKESVRTLLNEQIKCYLTESAVSFDTLRSIILSMQKVTSITDNVSHTLDATAIEKKSSELTRLTALAHERQIHEDKVEEQNERAQSLANKREISNCKNNISSLQTQLLVTNGVYLAYQLTHQTAYRKLAAVESEIRSLEQRTRQVYGRDGVVELNLHTRDAGTVITHARGDHPDPVEQTLRLKRSERDGLLAAEREQFSIYCHHESEKAKLEREIQKNTDRILFLQSQNDTFDANAVSRGDRATIRNRFRPNLERSALTVDNAKQLDRLISDKHKAIEDSLSRMREYAKSTCYQLFVEQVERELGTLRLEEVETSTLMQIIKQMKVHQQDLLSQSAAEDRLRSFESQLDSSRRQLADKQLQVHRYIQQNADLVNSNERLGTASSRLDSELRDVSAKRDAFAAYTGIALVGIGSSALSAYFLMQASVIALAPPVAIGLAIASSVVVVTLLVTAIVRAIQTSYKQAELNTCRETIRNQTNTIDQNKRTIAQSQGADIPGLCERITKLEMDCNRQLQITQDAQARSRASFNEARAIGASESGVKYDSRNSFFPIPSAPEDKGIPMAYAVVIEEGDEGRSVSPTSKG